jgi:hypothetical protein
MNERQEYETIDKFDRAYGAVKSSNALTTKQSTIQYLDPFTGKAETFIIQTARTDNGDVAFVQCIDGDGVVRMVLPPKVTNIMASQRDSLTTKRRSIVGKAVAQTRMEQGWKPTFQNKRKAKG